MLEAVAVRMALKSSSWGICHRHTAFKMIRHTLIAARKGSPYGCWVLAKTKEGEFFIWLVMPPHFIEYTRDVTYLNDNEVVAITRMAK